ncbi:hypothetical protein VKT23_014948 [Stygiomarasmius scandens]|uniref:Uncharacterized protein n=1 Tax=Marasmiellus scandens TaxID=2682957 RepID=A0ABR1IYW1_9AGAR
MSASALHRQSSSSETRQLQLVLNERNALLRKCEALTAERDRCHLSLSEQQTQFNAKIDSLKTSNDVLQQENSLLQRKLRDLQRELGDPATFSSSFPSSSGLTLMSDLNASTPKKLASNASARIETVLESDESDSDLSEVSTLSPRLDQDQVIELVQPSSLFSISSSERVTRRPPRTTLETQSDESDGELLEASPLLSVFSSAGPVGRQYQPEIQTDIGSDDSDRESEPRHAVRRQVPLSPPTSPLASLAPRAINGRKTCRLSTALPSAARTSTISTSSALPAVSTSASLKRKRIEHSSDDEDTSQGHKVACFSTHFKAMLLHRLKTRTRDVGNSLVARYSRSLSIDERVTILLRQCLRDIILTVPQTRTGGRGEFSYLSLSDAVRQDIDAYDDLFTEIKLSKIWSCCQYKVASRKDFDAAFNHLFPPHDEIVSPNSQGYIRCDYFRLWLNIRNTSGSLIMRMELKQKFSKLLWIPQASRDRLWNTSQNNAPYFARLPPGSNGPAPRILIRRRPEW